MSTEPPAPCGCLRHTAKCAWRSSSKSRGDLQPQPGFALHQGASTGRLGGCRQGRGVISAGAKHRFGAWCAKGDQNTAVGTRSEWDEQQGCAKICHEEPCQAMPCHATLAGTLIDPRLASQPGRGILPVLLGLAKA